MRILELGVVIVLVANIIMGATIHDKLGWILSLILVCVLIMS